MNELCKAAYADQVAKTEEEREEWETNRKMEEARVKLQKTQALEAIRRAFGLKLYPQDIVWAESSSNVLTGSFEHEGRIFEVGLQRYVYFLPRRENQNPYAVFTQVPLTRTKYEKVQVGTKGFFRKQPIYEERRVEVTEDEWVQIYRPANLIEYGIC